MVKRNIVNIINFIRGVDPRNPDINLLEPVENQIRLLKEYKLSGTFLIQYDAMLKEEFANLLKDEINENIEVGAWLEIVQPLVEKAGLHWRGREGFSWDWHGHVGFSVGYTTKEREKLVDVFMEDFKGIFGGYPSSVGSWLIDAHTLSYIWEKYGIVASCNCKDQWGTDGYTLWGGYYGQAYYPSRRNAFTPAQNPDSGIPVPVFRMLGSDPIYQYDAGLIKEEEFKSPEAQPVITLEPVYPEGGGSEEWVKWYLKENFNNLSLSFGYTQVGQENSFGWQAIGEGLENQLKLISEKVNHGELEVETLRDSGRWYKSVYRLTPSSSISALSDWRDGEHKSIWYNSRYYRINFFWEGKKFWIRDLHIFDEKYTERYLENVCEHKDFIYDNLPIMDGNRWSSGKIRAGIYPVNILKDGELNAIFGGEPVVTEVNEETLMIKLKPVQGGEFQIICRPQNIELSINGGIQQSKFALKMLWCEDINIPMEMVKKKVIQYKHNGYNYSISNASASFEKTPNSNEVLFLSNRNKIIISFGAEN